MGPITANKNNVSPILFCYKCILQSKTAFGINTLLKEKYAVFEIYFVYKVAVNDFLLLSSNQRAMLLIDIRNITRL